MPTSIELKSGTHSLIGKNYKELRQGDIFEALNSIYANFKEEGVKLEMNKDLLKQLSFNVLSGIKNCSYDSPGINKKFTIKMRIFYDDDKKKFSFATLSVTVPDNKEPIYTHSSRDYNAKLIKKESSIVLEGALKQKETKAIAKK